MCGGERWMWGCVLWYGSAYTCMKRIPGEHEREEGREGEREMEERERELPIDACRDQD